MAKDDPRTKLSEFQTSGMDDPAQKTWLLSKEQLSLYISYDQATAMLGPEFAFYREIAQKHMEAMMSYKGGRGEQTKEMFMSQREDRAIDGGHQPVRDYLKGRHGRSDSTGN